MAEVSVERRFVGSVRLVTLHLWRIAQSTNVEDGFAAARRLGMFTAENEAFVRSCLALSSRMEAGEALDDTITLQTVRDLQACALRLNSADPC